ncbi:uncharacterized protein DSM5745_03978 [Aspergillus mulundensis]|uniref:Uncharacterized protein n=1 Tax=Aspergillus mulundensis TaxID=1810919 RepID=A0A3D8SBC0_9EURO|nr:hypothetical protein DSM5745_03978 [Aspergillus mulundensis]RDW83652.1 hypothetical protein DSM5745_03978 [Aspergillus mulundensis]
MWIVMPATFHAAEWVMDLPPNCRLILHEEILEKDESRLTLRLIESCKPTKTEIQLPYGSELVGTLVVTISSICLSPAVGHQDRPPFAVRPTDSCQVLKPNVANIIRHQAASSYIKSRRFSRSSP